MSSELVKLFTWPCKLLITKLTSVFTSYIPLASVSVCFCGYNNNLFTNL